MDRSASVSLADSHAHCRRVTRNHARSFFFSSFALPAGKRRAAYAIYAFCRHADDSIDVACAQDPESKAAALDRLRRDLADALDGGGGGLPFAPAFAETVRRHDLPPRLFEELIHGVGLDTGRVRIADWAELEEYCYYVASVVGLIMARVFGLRAGDADGEARAIALGLAMQLTNILRDVGEDYARDRVYLPSDGLRAAGIAEEELGARSASPALREHIGSLVGRTEAVYASAEAGIRKLDDDGSRLTVWTMRHVYAGILDEIRALGCDVLSRRAATSFPRKLRLAARAWRRCRADRHGRRPR